ncbi:hypothetical protein OEZ85_009096 [Tetradesmus obliquus]|uniref:Uncharacterized protein n=1 Tax=Tetradesmus obliquus TaxID=3088 RepID=A0ABY8TKS9_TETOB|nr:hypothetical protein OEZ85_009096 [Tetradesmus obliquus]
MGNCFGKSTTQRRHDNWKATGIVALRDGGVRSIPSNLLAIAGSVRTLDLSNNSISDLAQEDLQGSLQELDVSNNQLSSLPAALGSLSKLKVLQADTNSIAAVPGQLLQGCSALHTLSLHSNPITPAELEGTPGYTEYDARRRGKYDKVLAGGALLGSAGLDDGLDRLLKAPSPN